MDDPLLRYQDLNRFDAKLMALDQEYNFLGSPHQIVSSASETDKVIVAERGPLVFVFNWSVATSYSDYAIGAGEPGKYRVVLSSDWAEFGGSARTGVDPFADHVSHGLEVFLAARAFLPLPPDPAHLFSPTVLLHGRASRLQGGPIPGRPSPRRNQDRHPLEDRAGLLPHR